MQLYMAKSKKRNKRIRILIYIHYNYIHVKIWHMCTLYIGKSKGRNKGFGSFYTYNIHVCNTCLSENRGKTELQDWKHNAYIYKISTHGETTKTARQQLLQFLQPEILKILDSIPGFASQFTIQTKDRKVWIQSRCALCESLWKKNKNINNLRIFIYNIYMYIIHIKQEKPNLQEITFEFESLYTYICTLYISNMTPLWTHMTTNLTGWIWTRTTI